MKRCLRGCSHVCVWQRMCIWCLLVALQTLIMCACTASLRSPALVRTPQYLQAGRLFTLVRRHGGSKGIRRSEEGHHALRKKVEWKLTSYRLVSLLPSALPVAMKEAPHIPSAPFEFLEVLAPRPMNIRSKAGLAQPASADDMEVHFVPDAPDFDALSLLISACAGTEADKYMFS